MAESKITAEFKEQFLEMLVVLPNVTAVCRLMGVHHSNLYRARKKDEDFDQKIREALDAGYDMVEEEARRRAVEGVLEPVYHQGEEVGQVRKYSDNLLMFLLKAYKKKFNPQAKLDFGNKKVTMVFDIGGDDG